MRISPLSRGARAPLAVLAALVVLVAGMPGAAAAHPRARAREAATGVTWGSEWVVPGSLVVTTRDGAAARRLGREGAAWLAAGGLQAGGVHEVAPGVSLVEVEAGSEAAAAEALRQRPGVAGVEPNYRFRFLAAPDDPKYAQQWAHAQTGIATAWQQHSTGAIDVKVAILDSGVDGKHPDLAGNLVAQVNAVTTIPGHDGTAGAPKDNVDCGEGTPGYDHGTAVAGVAGAVGHNATGVAGAAWRVGLVDVRVAGGSTSGCQGPDTGAVLRGLYWVGAHHDDVAAVNMSFGFPATHCPTYLQEAIDALRDKGVAIVAASGNDYGYDRMMPAGCDGVVAVGASRGDRRLASYSSRQRYLDLVAPGGELGEGVLTTVRSEGSGGTQWGYEVRAGTSFAAPYVTGVIALVQDLRARGSRPRLSPRQLEALLEITARHPDGSGRHDPRFGWGLLHAGDALQHVHDGKPIAPPRTHPLIRLAASGSTQPVGQAIAISRAMFDRREALHVLIARSDDYADALAGSGLGFGVGPVLFTAPGKPLDSRVRAEIQRVLAPGGRVYLLGGTQAVDQSVEQGLDALGFDTVRLRGGAREDTAAAVAAEVVKRVGELSFPVHTDVIVATRGNWPDAVAAGSLASVYGLPVLLTPAGSLHKAARDALGALDPSRVYVVGGTAAVSAATATAIGQAAGVTPRRLSGAARDGTAVAVGRELQRRLALGGATPPLAVAVNLDRSDAYAHTLAASAITGLTASVFVPVRWTQASGARVTGAVGSYACGVTSPDGTDPGGGVDVVLAGGSDLLPTAIGQELQDLYDRPSSAC